MTLTLRIDDDSATAEQLEWIKNYFGIKTNSEAITRAIAHFSRFEEEKNDRDLRIENFQILQSKANYYKHTLANFVNMIDKMRDIALKE